MSNRMICLAAAALLAVACNRNGVHRDAQQNYDVVQEGAANGVTAAIGTGQTPPLTNTNADTTSNFALDPNTTAATASAEGSIADSMPPPAAPPAFDERRYPPMTSAAPRPAAPRPSPVTAQPEPAQPATQPRTATAAPQPAPPEQDEAAPPPSETAPPTDTADEAEDAAPPPTTTDTVGGFLALSS